MNSAETLRYHLNRTYQTLGQPGATVRIPPPQRFDPDLPGGHFHLRAELFLQVEAGTRFQFCSENLDLGPGQVLIVPAKVWHAETLLPGTQPFCNVVLYADDDALSCHIADKGPGGRPRIAYPESRHGPVGGQLARWLDDAVSLIRLFDDPVLAVNLVRSVIATTLKILDHPEAPGSEEPLPLVRCRRMIHEELGNPDLSVAMLAHRLGCNADYLSHLFRMVRGTRLTTYIEELRMVRAADLLSKSLLSCKEVAWASGYASQSYFIRCFRDRWGMSPLGWRQKHSSPGSR